MSSKSKETLHACLHNVNFMIGFFMLLSVVLVAIFADKLAPSGYTDFVDNAFLSPSQSHWFGTDELGRDVLSRVIYGTRITLKVAILGASLELIIGVVVGLSCGYFGGAIDHVFTFLTDLTWCIPGTILALAVVTLIGKSLTNSVIAIAMVCWASYARPIRAKTMSLKTMAFVETGKAFGESSAALMFRYILPNVIPSLIVMVSTTLPGTILSTTTLSFLGMGSQAPSPDWGLNLSKGMDYIGSAPWLSIFPGIALVYTVLGFSLLGEGIRDILDPHLKSQ
ncbi:MAG: ABC transporter permease [Firmicutes bacterium]|jgi:peptide/nickel transport system permease protein|nr:ABC transporter permease [Bacillota bacterium]MCR4724747.1 ABC transporter permease [Clostridia bacterium]MBQ4409677.1 ABC transporter permease [Bacillota bacterium]MBQ6294590.1 ABC transporter permease [Bacillota bacterium]MBR0052019.1 ABC transporter permease [Bacillota bacterium]